MDHLSLGCAPIANLGRVIEPDQARQTIDAAWDAGVRYFDVAPHYGLGLGEVRLGEALAMRPRDEFIVSTKVGRVLEDTGVPTADDEGFSVTSSLRRRRDYTRDGVLRSIEDSLSRLGLDRIDIVFVHDPEDYFDESVHHAFPALEELRQQGVIRSYGAGMNQAGMLAAFIRETQADVMMCAGRYTLIDREGADLMDLAADRDVSIVAAGVFNSGLLARETPSATATFDYQTVSASVLERARRIAALCESHGIALPAAAAQFPLRHPAVATVCLGARSPEQIERNAELFHPPAPEALWEEIDEFLLAG